ncbi:hypothetical protein A2U01_0053404, partial [Trifolium medium]|nr:hypothetical protein [Trifolium medium]
MAYGLIMQISAPAAKIKVLTAIQLSANLMTGFPNADEQKILQLLAVTPSTAVTPSAAMKMVLWCTPGIGWMKGGYVGTKLVLQLSNSGVLMITKY